jgi:hypothetical protein
LNSQLSLPQWILTAITALLLGAWLCFPKFPDEAQRLTVHQPAAAASWSAPSTEAGASTTSTAQVEHVAAAAPEVISAKDAQELILQTELSQDLHQLGIQLPGDELIAVARTTAVFERLRREHEAQIAELAVVSSGPEKRYRFVIPAYGEFGAALRDALYLTLRRETSLDEPTFLAVFQALAVRFGEFGAGGQVIDWNVPSRAPGATHIVDLVTTFPRGRRATLHSRRETLWVNEPEAPTSAWSSLFARIRAAEAYPAVDRGYFSTRRVDLF